MGFSTKEILLVINTPIVPSGWSGKIQGGHLEHVARTFGITSCNDGSMNPEESPLLKKIMDCVGKCVSNTGNGAEGVGSGS